MHYISLMIKLLHRRACTCHGISTLVSNKSYATSTNDERWQEVHLAPHCLPRSSGQLGLGHFEDRNVPTSFSIGSVGTVIHVACGAAHTVAIVGKSSRMIAY